MGQTLAKHAVHTCMYVFCGGVVVQTVHVGVWA